MKWTDETRIETPEQIGLDMELAGLGSRFLAQLVDWLWKVLLTAGLALVAIVILGLLGMESLFKNLAGAMLAAVVALVYVVWLTYAIAFEVRGNGQTPGKRAAGIRVVRANGAPVDFQAVSVRNLLAVADFLPVFYLLGAVLILLTEKRQRLGDVAAGTIVVRERTDPAAPEPIDELIAYATPDFAFTPAQLAALTREDANVVREFLRRFPEMEHRSRTQLTEKMVRVFRDKTGHPVSADLDWEQARAFLASLLRDLEEFRRNG
ncbi:Marine sediment metagenome DNA, contig: S06H3_S11843 (Fragment) OS=marine sediment metagenome GN=S06H3_42614 PE=4 SV=1: RDD [Gemmataceae bacterium]